MTEQLRESTSATLKGQSNNVDTANGTTDRDGVKGDVKVNGNCLILQQIHY